MTQCQTPQETASFVSDIVDKMVREYLLSGVVQAGLRSCESDAYLNQNAEVVLCAQLHEVDERLTTAIEQLDENTILRLENITTTLQRDLYEKLLEHCCSGGGGGGGGVATNYTNCNDEPLPIDAKLVTFDCLEAGLDELKDELEAQIITYKNCADEPLPANAKVVTVECLASELDELKDELEVQIVSYKNCDDEPLPANAKVVTVECLSSELDGLKDELEAQIISYKNCADEPLPANAKVVTADCLASELDELKDELEAQIITYKNCDDEPLPANAKVVTEECLNAQMLSMELDVETYVSIQLNIAINNLRNEFTETEATLIATINQLRDRIDELEQ